MQLSVLLRQLFQTFNGRFNALDENIFKVIIIRYDQVYDNSLISHDQIY